MSRTILIALVWVSLFVGSALGQVTLHVPTAVFPTIQSALNASSSDDLVLVAAGTYFENVLWPMHPVTLRGTGPQSSIIDGGQAGSCVAFYGGGTTSVLEGFTLTNGSGTPTLASGLAPAGGGVQILQSPGNVLISPIIKNCEFIGNTATLGGGLFTHQASAVLKNCKFSNNSVSGIGSAGSGCFFRPTLPIVIDGCTFTQHSSQALEFDQSSIVNSFTMTNSHFIQNSGVHALYVVANNIEVDACTFTENSTTSDVLLLVSPSTGTGLAFRSSIVANNSGSRAVTLSSIVQAPIFENVSNVTIVNNTTTMKPVSLFGNGLLAGSIIQGNVDGGGQAWATPIEHPANNSTFFFNYLYNYEYCNIQGMSGLGIAGIDVPPQFVDELNGDYRLLPGSPMIDAGAVIPNYVPSATDLAGHDRIRGNAIDMGAFEAQSPGHANSSAGRVGEFSGGPYEVLRINGDTGGVLRRLTAPIGASATMEMLQPPNVAGPCNFSIFGILGEASFDTVVNVPLGISDMVFAPAPMAPYLQPVLFTLASSVGPIQGVLPLFPATPTPWNSGPGPAIPFPLTITIQGVIEESPGVFTPTNALAYIVE